MAISSNGMMSGHRGVNALRSLSDVKVLVFGDLMLDHYVWGDVTRISPEAPVPVVKVVRESYSAGGAANVALNLKGLGVQTRLAGHIGRDVAGDRLRELLSARNIETLSHHCRPDVPTIIKTRVLAQNQQLCRIDREGDYPDYQSLPLTWEIWEQHIVTCDAIIVSDYAKGLVTQDVLNRLVQLTQMRSQILAMDPKPTHQLNLSGMTLLTPNRQEALQLAEMNLSYRSSPFPIQEVAKRIYERYSPRYLVITLGAEGMAICADGVVTDCIPTVAKQVFDVSGAGDTVIATLVASLAAGASLLDAAKLANQAAGIVVSKVGTVPITAQELFGTSNPL